MNIYLDFCERNGIVDVMYNSKMLGRLSLSSENYYVFFPSSDCGGFSDFNLKQIVDKLKDLNVSNGMKKWRRFCGCENI